MDPAYALPRNGIKAEPTPMEILDLLPQNLADLCTRFFNLYEPVLHLTRILAWPGSPPDREGFSSERDGHIFLA